MSKSVQLFAFFKLLGEEQRFFGKSIALESGNYTKLLEMYDPWEWSDDLQSAPVDYLLGLGFDKHHKSIGLGDEIWKVLEMCLTHPNAPPAHTWSARLSCINDRGYDFYSHTSSDRRLPWLHALATGVLSGKIQNYAQLGGTLDATFKGLSPLMMLYESEFLNDWFLIASRQKIDLTTGNLGQYFKSWSSFNHTNMTSLGRFADTVRDVREKYSPLSPEEKVFEEWLEVVAACTGFKNTSAKSKDPLLRNYLQDESRQKMMLDAVMSTITSVENDRFQIIQSKEEGALKIISKVWNTYVPKTSMWQKSWEGVEAYYAGLGVSALAPKDPDSALEALWAFRQTLEKSGLEIGDQNFARVLYSYRRCPEHVRMWATEGTLPIYQTWEDIKNLSPDPQYSQSIVAMVGNAVRAHDTHSFLRLCSTQYLQSHLDAIDEDDLLPVQWCNHTLRACEMYQSNERVYQPIDLIESVANKHILKHSLRDQHANFSSGSSRRKM